MALSYHLGPGNYQDAGSAGTAVASGVLPGPEMHYTYAFVNAGPARWSNSFA
jgi:hypothetical protein